MARCWAFVGPADDRGASIGERPVGVLGSGIVSMWPFRRDYQKAVGRKMFFSKYVRAQSA